jgi:hypothetical protein
MERQVSIRTKRYTYSCKSRTVYTQPTCHAHSSTLVYCRPFPVQSLNLNIWDSEQGLAPPLGGVFKHEKSTHEKCCLLKRRTKKTHKDTHNFLSR